MKEMRKSRPKNGYTLIFSPSSFDEQLPIKTLTQFLSKINTQLLLAKFHVKYLSQNTALFLYWMIIPCY